MAKKETGRPTLFTAKVQKKLMQAFEKYAPIITACSYAGIHKQTFFNWRHYAEQCKLKGEENDHTIFFDSLLEIQSKRVIGLINRVVEGEKGWQGASWYLERVHANVFGANADVINRLTEKLEELEKKLVDKK
jgi:hypothetical protein